MEEIKETSSLHMRRSRERGDQILHSVPQKSFEIDGSKHSSEISPPFISMGALQLNQREDQNGSMPSLSASALQLASSIRESGGLSRPSNQALSQLAPNFESFSYS